ncbi:hypothetical protein [Deinococcus sp. LM3]|uniref:hypothetical protein n=1 Tax=Deinococcus sp. LM3 TaxID=1938608 RepID=UPI0009C89754|nr:hypothetical protein [Deinococcus sp. LM3]OOV11910.1 hypothetical protein BXU09_19350 [Deinococcus sp. LM3]OOV11978.1 hypothetical protein BXU09_18695 [Deinococcus sp. LM3]
MEQVMRQSSIQDVPLALRRALTYTLSSVIVFLLVLLALRYGEAFRLNEAWYSPQALWRNIEATWPDFLRLGLLTLFPAALLSAFGRTAWTQHGLAALVTAALLTLWSTLGGFGGTLALLPAALGGIALVAAATALWHASRRLH